MKRLIVLFAALALVAAACGGGDDTADDSTTTSVESTTSTTAAAPTTTTRPTTTTAGVGVAGEPWPLTGIAAEAGDQINAEVLIAKYSNAPNGRPQEGIEAADVLMEVVVEGGVVRILAAFHSEVPDEIGPLRSAREVDPKLIAPFDAFFASSGGQGAVMASIGAVAENVSDGRVTGYFRKSGRPAPYDLFFTTDAVFDAAEREAPTDDLMTFDTGGADEDSTTGEQALSVEIDISSFHTTNYRWSTTDDAYLRFNGETAHLAADDSHLTAENVVVVFVDTLSTGRVDGSGAPVPDYDVVGMGDALVFRDGVAITGTWERGSVDTFFRLFDENGVMIALAPGTTWFEITPSGRTVEWQ